MRTYTVVPSFEGESAFFELPDIGFQGDHLSFAILFNLTELVEHWPDILPSMIVTDPKGNTFIAPHTGWDAEKHIFTWAISSTETAYEGYVRCQLKCISSADPETIVCMSRICQTRVYQSLAAAEDPPEAFQEWIDTLVELGAQINADAAAVLASVETTEVNARSAQTAADEAELSKNAAQQARSQTELAAQIAASAQEAATTARQGAQQAATAAEAAKVAAQEAQASAEQALEETDVQAAAAAASARSASDSAQQAATSMSNSRNAQTAAEQARDAAIAAKGYAETAQERAEEAEEGAFAANNAAERAQAAAEDYAETSKKWSIGLDRNDNPVSSDDPTYNNYSKYHSEQSDASRIASETARDASANSANVSKKWATGVDMDNHPVESSDPAYHDNAKYWAEQSSTYADYAIAAKDIIVNVNVSSAKYSSEDESITVILGGGNVIDDGQGGGNNV